MELTDLEINKCISLIGLQEQFPNAKSIEFDERQSCFWVETVGFSSYPLLKPLTDDGLCFQIMVKHDINLTSMEPTLKDGSDGYEYTCYKQGAYQNVSAILSINKSPNKTICLAIIEASK